MGARRSFGAKYDREHGTPALDLGATPGTVSSRLSRRNVIQLAPETDVSNALQPARTHHQGKSIMPAYVILDITVDDPELFEEYKKLAPATIKAYGGKYIARGGKAETLEGDWTPNRIVILEFENADTAKAWLESPEYREARAMRQTAATSNTIVVDGV